MGHRAGRHPQELRERAVRLVVAFLGRNRGGSQRRPAVPAFFQWTATSLSMSFNSAGIPSRPMGLSEVCSSTPCRSGQGPGTFSTQRP